MVALHSLVFYHVSFTCWNWVPILAVNFFTKLGIEDSLKFAATEILTLKFGNPNLRVQQPPFSSHKGDQSFPLGTMRKMKAPLKQQHAHRNLAFHFRQCSRFCYVKREIKKTRRKQNKPKDEREKMKRFLLNHKNNRREEAVGDGPKTERKEIFRPSLLQRCDDESLTAAVATRQETTASHETLTNISSSKPTRTLLRRHATPMSLYTLRRPMKSNASLSRRWSHGHRSCIRKPLAVSERWN